MADLRMRATVRLALDSGRARGWFEREIGYDHPAVIERNGQQVVLAITGAGEAWIDIDWLWEMWRESGLRIEDLTRAESRG